MIGWLIVPTSFFGTLLVIAPTFQPVEQLLIDTDRINALSEARHQLLEFDQITNQDWGFNEVRDIFKKEASQQDWDSVAGIYPEKFGVYGGGGGWIYLLDEQEINLDNPRGDGSPESFESILITDQWLRDEINRLRSQPKQQVRGVGFVLLIVSVLAQALTYL